MVPEETKHCPKCDKDKPLDTFGRNRSRPDGLQAWCKLCSKRNQRDRRRAQGARSLPSKVPGKKWCPSCKQLKLEEEFAKNRSRPDGLTAYCKICNAATRVAYYQKLNGGKVNYAAILARDGLWCYLCEKDILNPNEIHFDHVFPISAGGEHSEENIRVTHARCNLSKGSKVLTQTARKTLLETARQRHINGEPKILTQFPQED